MSNHQMGGKGTVSFWKGLVNGKRGGKRRKRRARIEPMSAPCGVEKLEDRLLMAADFTVVDRVNVGTGGAEANAMAENAMISSNGRFIVFNSTATNLVAGDNNGVSDVFVMDCQTGVTELISVNDNGEQGNQGSFEAAITPDGRFVVFRSMATNLGGSGNTTTGEIYVRDRNTDQTFKISDTFTFGGVGGFAPAISSNGRYVTYLSATNDGVNQATQVYRFDRTGGRTDVVTFADPLFGNGNSGQPVVSTSGDVFFHSQASDLVSGDNNGVSDIFMWEAGAVGQPGTITRIASGNGGSFNAQISSDGRFLVFESDATNLVAGDTNGQRDVFLLTTANGNITLVSTSTAGDDANGASTNASVSDNGRIVVFASAASNLANGDDNGQVDIFLRDVQAGTTKLLSANAAGDEGNAASTMPDISGDGSTIVFQSNATNLIASDTNGATDVFGVSSQFTAINGVDLRAQITDARLPAALIGGQDARGSVRVDVSNIGSTPTASGQDVLVQVVLRPTGGGPDIVVGSSTVNVSSLDAGDSRSANVNVDIPETVGVGTYDVVVLLDPDAQVVGEVDTSNNIAINAQQLVIADPFVNLDIEVDDDLPVVMVPGDRGRLTVNINNIGNVDASGELLIRVVASLDENLDAGDLLLGEDEKRVRLRAGRGTRANFNFRGFESNVPEGDYFIIVDVQPISGDQVLLDAGRAIEVGPTQHEIIWAFGQVGDRNNVRMTLLDLTGEDVRFQMSGPGTGNVAIDNGAFDLDIINADNSSVRFQTRADVLVIDDVTADGSINSLDGGRNGNLTGVVNINGAVNRLRFNDVTGASATINGPLNMFQANNVSNFDLTVVGNDANRVQVNEWIGGTLSANVVNQLQTRRGDFAADVNAVALNRGTFGGNVHDANFTLSQAVGGDAAVGRLQARGDLMNVVVRSVGDIDSVMANAIVNSQIFAGVDPAETGLPDSAADFTSAAIINQVRARSFQGSQIGSSILGRMDLGDVTAANGGVALGLSSRTFDQISYILNGERISARANDVSSVVLEDDFVIRVLT